MSHLDSPSSHLDGFPKFACLPGEIRQEIWRQALPRNRLIMVDFRPSQNGDQGPPSTEKNELGKETSGSAYRPVVPGAHLYSSLLGVNRESRSEALRIYRVLIPCLVWAGKTTTTKEAVLYFSPERDFLHLHNTSQGSVRETLVDFFYDLKAYDPHGVGIRNLAVDYRTLDAWDRFLRPPEIEPPSARAAYLETLAQLQRVFCLSLTDLDRAHQVAFGPVRCFEIRALRPFMALLEEQTDDVVHQWHGPRGPVDEGQRRELRTAIRSIRVQFAAQWSQVLAKGGVDLPSRAQQQQRPLLELWAVRDWDAWDGGDRLSTNAHESEDWQGELAWVLPSSSDDHDDRREPTRRSPVEVEAAFGFWLSSAGAGEGAGSGLPELGLLTF
ncbi:hypothetical protein PG985_007607 [Apiospora marii]|uniref:2EXR domain-containing protein n=1 Tax=Apiospora marii TaxID=335849 RepID=A0ABR1SN13_9PEZI